MSNQMLLAAIIGPLLLVLGLSLLIYSDVWKRLTGEWEKNHFPIMGMMVFNLIFGLTVINLHNVWELSPFLVVTIVGWGAFLKGAAYFLLPGDHFKKVVKALNCKCYFQTVGVVCAVLGAWLSYLVYLA